MKLAILLLSSIEKYWISITLFILTLITFLSLLPLEELPPVPGTDKTHHLIAYAALILPTSIKKPKHWLTIAFCFTCWSGAIELLQPHVNRYGEWRDLLANITGLTFGWSSVKLFGRFYPIDRQIK